MYIEIFYYYYINIFFQIIIILQSTNSAKTCFFIQSRPIHYLLKMKHVEQFIT